MPTRWEKKIYNQERHIKATLDDDRIETRKKTREAKATFDASSDTIKSIIWINRIEKCKGKKRKKAKRRMFLLRRRMSHNRG